MTENWKAIEGYEGIYEISDLGRVKVLPRMFIDKMGRSINTKEIIKVCPKNHRGYNRVQLTDKFKNKRIYSVHRLVAKAFIPNPLNLPEVNHKLGVKTDNRASELEWCNKLYNEKHAIEMGLKPKGSKHKMAILDETQVRTILRCVSDKIRRKDLATYFKVSIQTIHAIAIGRNWGWIKTDS